jgi:hypothetical protein
MIRRRVVLSIAVTRLRIMGGEYRIVLNRSEWLLSLEWKNIAGEEIRLSTSFLRDVASEAGGPW